MTCAGHCKHQPCPTAWDCAIQSKEGGEYVIHGEGHPLPPSPPEKKPCWPLRVIARLRKH